MRTDSATGLSSCPTPHKAHRVAAALLLAGGFLLMAPGLARADVITDVNDALLNIFQNTSASLIDGPPEVAREIAMVDGAMFDAVNAASGSPVRTGRLWRRRSGGCLAPGGGAGGGGHRDEQSVRQWVAVSAV